VGGSVVGGPLRALVAVARPVGGLTLGAAVGLLLAQRAVELPNKATHAQLTHVLFLVPLDEDAIRGVDFGDGQLLFVRGFDLLQGFAQDHKRLVADLGRQRGSLEVLTKLADCAHHVGTNAAELLEGSVGVLHHDEEIDAVSEFCLHLSIQEARR